MSSVRLISVAIFFYACVSWTSALPRRSGSNGVSSGAGEIPGLLSPDYYPFDGPLGKGYPDNEVSNNYDFDSENGPRFPSEFDVNGIPHEQPQGGGGSKIPLKPDNRIPEDEHPEDEPKKEPEEEEDHEPTSDGKPKDGDETYDDEEEEAKTPEGSEEKDIHVVEDEEKYHGSEEKETKIPEGEEKIPHGSEEEDTHGVEDEKKPQEDEEESTQDAEEEIPLPLKPALFSFQQVNHYIKQLEKAMEHVFQDTLENASLLNNTFANTTEEEVEVNGHKYKVQKSIIETGDEDKNSTLFIEAISSVNEDEAKKNKSKRSNPDAEPIQ